MESITNKQLEQSIEAIKDVKQAEMEIAEAFRQLYQWEITKQEAHDLIARSNLLLEEDEH